MKLQWNQPLKVSTPWNQNKIKNREETKLVLPKGY